KGSLGCLFMTFGVGSGGLRRRALRAVALAELVDAAGRVHHLLLARVERVALRADFDVKRLRDRRPRREYVAAAAGDLHFGVLGVDACFHYVFFRRVGPASPRWMVLAVALPLEVPRVSLCRVRRRK